jgi:deazaflavin-dependent oxidoreductase (nitroreductase family)
MASFNDGIIEEFRASAGRVGGQFEGMRMLLLTTTGRRSGQPRTSPLVYLPDGDRLVVFATYGGQDVDPLWYGNLLADPKVTVEVGTETYTAVATPVTGAERDRLWDAQVVAAPAFGRYPRLTSRVIPVVALERDGATAAR